MTLNNEQALDLLFGENTDAKTEFYNLKGVCEEGAEQISTNSMNDKTLMDNVKEKAIEFMEHNNLLPDPNAKPISEYSEIEESHIEEVELSIEQISTVNSEKVTPKEIMDNPVSSHNSSQFV